MSAEWRFPILSAGTVHAPAKNGRPKGAIDVSTPICGGVSPRLWK